MAAVHEDPFQKAIDHLEAERAILTNFTNFWKNLSSHISSLEQTLQQALESLATREESLPSKELAASERVERLKEAALAQIEEHREEGEREGSPGVGPPPGRDFPGHTGPARRPAFIIIIISGSK